MPDVSSRIAARKKRWVDFLKLDGKQAFLHVITCTEGSAERPFPAPENGRERIEWAWAEYQRRLQAVEWLEDDSLPFLDPYTGTEIFAAAFGCAVAYPPDNMPFARQLIDGPAGVAPLRVPSVFDSPLRLHFQIADELRRRAGPDALMRLIDVQSPMDIAALIWDKNTFYTGIMDSPEAVRELAAKTGELLVSFLDQWFARYGRSFMAHFPEYYMPFGLTLSEDEVGSVSPGMFEDFFLPELSVLSRRYGALGMHCCANARHQWKGFTRIPGLVMLNLVQPKEVCGEAHDFFARVCGQMHGWEWEWDLAKGPGQFPADAHIVLTSTVDNRTDALRRAETFHRLFR